MATIGTRQAKNGSLCQSKLEKKGEKMRLLNKVLFGIILLGILSSAAFGFKNEPRGFRGLSWGDCPTPDMELLDPDEQDPAIYVRPGDKLELGDATLIAIAYNFCKVSYNRRELVSVSLLFAGKENWKIMEDICREKFGKPYQDRLYRIYWMSLKSFVGLEYNIFEQDGLLMMGHSHRLAKYDEQRKKRKAKEAEKDW